MSRFHADYLSSAPEEWPKSTLAELGTISSGSTPKREVPAYWGGSIAWVTPGELTGLGQKYLNATRDTITDGGLSGCSANLLPEGALLVTTRATLGSVAVTGIPMATNQGFRSIVPSSEASVDFLYHLFPKITPELERRASGTTFLEISGREFSKIELRLPPLPEQQLIASILDTVDEVIRKTEEVIAKLQQMKQGLLHDLLTRGIDDNGELRDPDRHPEQFKDSPLGRIPKDWEVDRVGALLKDIEQGWSPDCPSWPAQAGEWGVLRTTAVVWAGYQDNENKVLPGYLRARPEYEVRPKDVLMTRAGPNSRVGVVALVTHTQGRLMLSDKLYRLGPGETVLPEFLVLGLSGARTQRHLSTLKTGLAESQTNISQAIVRALRFQSPSLSEQREIVAVAEKHERCLAAEQAELNKLRLLKSGLMDDLLTGRVRVTDLLPTSTP